ncbi:hypothetical protein L211DRAFT_868414 [Terfezia boudieri ATCC MYA-4762]|uniref:Uncharacterized protein n=1 Tax=Terfezia boudieri ATCC MYA-4762 TaxID=1051890 RepID=A0A3N4LQA3_9PEZI|nr:hypothetical protein L211DRAFT_868414 [Terfezia boudieri ATCC MYA-4762]
MQQIAPITGLMHVLLCGHNIIILRYPKLQEEKSSDTVHSSLITLMSTQANASIVQADTSPDAASPDVASPDTVSSNTTSAIQHKQLLADALQEIWKEIPESLLESL